MKSAVEGDTPLVKYIEGGIVMKGSIHCRKDRGTYFVQWWNDGKKYTISKYNGVLIDSRRVAEKLRACMQADQERADRGEGTFSIEKYLYQSADVIRYLDEWLKVVESTLSYATRKDYRNSIENHLKPWFVKHPVMLNEIKHDVLCALLSDIKREGKGKLNVMYCLHRCLDFAWRSGRISYMPPFPEKSQYGLIKKPIKWVDEVTQIKIIEAIPTEHQPIFWWLKYHLRRPSEAMALHKEDYDKARDQFIVHRAFSAKKLVERTKTGEIHYIPCHPEFKPIMERMPLTFSKFFFVNPVGKLPGKHYQHDMLVDLWNKACLKVGVDISLYKGLKHSSCSQYINEKGLSLDELRMLTDHANIESVKQYADVQLETKRKLMTRKVVEIGSSMGVGKK